MPQEYHAIVHNAVQDVLNGQQYWAIGQPAAAQESPKLDKYPMFIKMILQQEKGFLPLRFLDGMVFEKLLIESEYWNLRPISVEVIDIEPISKSTANINYDFVLHVPACSVKEFKLRKEGFTFYEAFSKPFEKHIYDWYKFLAYGYAPKGSKYAKLKDTVGRVLDKLKEPKSTSPYQEPPERIYFANGGFIDAQPMQVDFNRLEMRVAEIMADPAFRRQNQFLDDAEFEDYARQRAQAEEDEQDAVPAQPVLRHHPGRAHRPARVMEEDIAVPMPAPEPHPDEDWLMEFDARP